MTRSRIRLAGIALLAAAATPVSATEYHVAAGACSHGSAAGSDAASGTSRSSALRTVQACLNKMKAGDTCTIHGGTYVGNATTKRLVGTPAAPSRIVGAAGDRAVLQGTTGQLVPRGETNAYKAGIATLTVKADGLAYGSAYVEVGNLHLVPGNGPALAMPRVKGFWVHDLTVDGLGPYAPPLVTNNQGEKAAAEGTGVIWLWGASNGFVENVRIDNNGTPRYFHALHNSGPNVRFRMIDVADMRGSINQGHGSDGLIYEFIKVRNHQPYTKDDGGLIHLYNNSQTIVRYLDAQEASGPDTAPFWYIGTRRSTNPSPCTNGYGPSSAYFTNLYMEGDGADGDFPIGTNTQEADGCGVNDWRAYNNVFQGWTAGINIQGKPAAGSPACKMLDFSHNAYVAVTRPVSAASGACDYASRVEPGRIVAAGDASLAERNHVPGSGSVLKDAGSSARFGPTPLFPPPVGGGGRIDIGAYEVGAGNWPYEFQTIATTSRRTPKICWATGIAGCDVVIPLWDPWAATPAARKAAPAAFEIQIDPANHFASGRSGVARGFGPMFSSGAISSSNRFYVVPSGVLAPGRSYYVQIRVAQVKDQWKGQAYGNGGWGPWSVGFYRFAVSSTATATAAMSLDASAADGEATGLPGAVGNLRQGGQRRP